MPNVPPLRFPEFSGEWGKCTLGEIMSYSKDRVPSNTLTDDNYVSTENMLPQFGGIYRAQNAPSNGSAIAYQKGDTLLSNIRPYLKKVWLANNNGGCSADVFVLKSVNEKCNSDFLYYLVANDNFISYVMNGAKGVKMPRGDKEQIKKYQLSIPSKKEQCKITELLSKLDQRIATQIRVIDKLESLIKGIRATVFNNVQPNTKLGEIADIYQPQTIASTECNRGQYLVFGANGVIGRYEQYNHEQPQICITCRGNTCGTVNFSEPFSWITGNAMVINIDNNKEVNKRYLFHYLSTQNFHHIISGSGQPQIVRSPLLKFPIYLPSMQTQVKLAEMLDLLRSRLKTEQDILEKYQQQKAYLLQNMFI